MANEYGLDHKYFKGKLDLIIRDASRYTPDEMARSLARLSCAADKKVLLEPEFSHWFNVKDKQPEAEQGNKILGFNGDYVFECEFDDGVWCNIGGEEMTHWRPMLELPKLQQ